MDDLLTDFLTETNECLADLDSALVWSWKKTRTTRTPSG